MKHYTEEFKQYVINLYWQSASVRQISTEYSICKATIYNWIRCDKRIFSKFKNNFVKYSDYEKLQQQLKRKTLEFEIFQELHCFKDATTKEKEIAISKLVGKYPIKTMCRLLDLPTGTFYNYHFRRKEVTQNQLRDEQLKREIYRIFKESEGRFGPRKIFTKLKSIGVNTSINKVQNLMKLLNLKSTQCIRKSELQTTDNSQYYTNKLNRIFDQTAPNKYWVSDVTEVRVGRNKFFLCVILDLFSRKVIAYRLSSQNNTQLTINTFKDAFESRNRPTELSFHSDQGANYTSFEFRDLLHSLRINQSFSKSGNPYDNACMESFFSNFKREEYNAKHYEFFDELEASVDSYMKYYNGYRPHQSLNNRTPNEYEDDYFASCN